jgi:hypothetical protein
MESFYGDLLALLNTDENMANRYYGNSESDQEAFMNATISI